MGEKSSIEYDGGLSASWIDTRLWMLIRAAFLLLRRRMLEVPVQSRPGFEYVELFSVLFVVASCVYVLESAFLQCENSLE